MTNSRSTILIETRKPNRAERKRGAEIVFIRTNERTGRSYTILACRCYESWEQWGVETEVLSDNVDAVENWRHGGAQ